MTLSIRQTLITLALNVHAEQSRWCQRICTKIRVWLRRADPQVVKATHALLPTAEDLAIVFGHATCHWKDSKWWTWVVPFFLIILDEERHRKEKTMLKSMNLQEKCIWYFVERRRSFQQIFYWIQMATRKGANGIAVASITAVSVPGREEVKEKHRSLSALLPPSCSWVCFLT